MSRRGLIDRTGAPWHRSELRIYYDALEEHGKDWPAIAEGLPNRSKSMVRALHAKYRTFFTKKTTTVSFVASVYASQQAAGAEVEDESDDEVPRPKAVSKAKQPTPTRARCKGKRKRESKTKEESGANEPAEEKMADFASWGEKEVSTGGGQLLQGLNALTQYAEAALTNNNDSPPRRQARNRKLEFNSPAKRVTKQANKQATPQKRKSKAAVEPGSGSKRKRRIPTTTPTKRAKAEHDSKDGVIEGKKEKISRKRNREVVVKVGGVIVRGRGQGGRRAKKEQDAAEKNPPKRSKRTAPPNRRFGSLGTSDIGDFEKNAYISDEHREGLVDGVSYTAARRRFTNSLHYPKFRRWCMYEWFYCAMDRLYYSQNEFVECLVQRGLESGKKMTRRKWRDVRVKIGAPRRLSASFFNEERLKLEHFRNEMRRLQTLQAENTPIQLLSSLEMVATPRLHQNQRVTAIHPDLNEIYVGSVIGSVHLQTSSVDAVPSLHYRVKFDQHPIPVIVPDTDIMGQVGVLPREGAQWLVREDVAGYGYGNSNAPQPPPFPLAENDVRTVSSLLRLLDKKKALVDHLKDMNSVAENIKTEQALSTRGISTPNKKLDDPPNGIELSLKLPSTFKQQYAWVIVQLERTSQELEGTLLSLRQRQRKRFPLPLHGTEDKALISDEIVGKRAVTMVKEVIQTLIGNNEIAPTSSLSTEAGSAIQEAIVSCITLVMMIKKCTKASQLLELDPALDKLRPSSHTNLKYFEKIKQSIEAIRSSLSSS